MFRSVSLMEMDGELNEESMLLEDTFFFTINISDYYMMYNRMAEVIGVVPLDYNLFFKVEYSESFEDVDMDNLLRLHDDGTKFQLIGSGLGSKPKLINSEDIARIELIEDGEFTIPFTNQAFDSDGVVVFKNMNALIDSVETMSY